MPSGPPHHAHNNTTNMQYETKTHKIHTDKNCSSKCAYGYAQLQYTIQHRTVLIISYVTSRHVTDDDDDNDGDDDVDDEN